MTSLLEMLLTRHSKTEAFLSFQAVQLVADLCLEYQVYDPQLWNSLLQKLLGFNLVRTVF